MGLPERVDPGGRPWIGIVIRGDAAVMLADDQWQILSRLAALHHRSLPTYLTYAKPWIPTGKEDEALVIDDIAADHHDLVERILNVLERDDRAVHLGGFPMEYTSLNDLSFGFILNKLKVYHRQLLVTLEELMAEAEKDSPAYRLGNMAIGMAVGHLQNLEEMDGPSRAARV